MDEDSRFFEGVSLTLRDADFNTDREFARRVHHEAYRDVVMKQFGEWNEELQDQFFEDGWSKGMLRQIIVVDGVDAGVVQRMVRESVEDELFLSELQLLPQFQQRGIGSAILRQRDSSAAPGGGKKSWCSAEASGAARE